MNKYKVVVAHPYQQHSYKTAVALKKCGYLYSYVTTVYDKDNFLMKLVKLIIKGDNLKRANCRKCPDLNNDDVIKYCEALSLFLLLLYRIDKSKKIYNRLNDYVLKKFNVKLAKYIIKNNVDVVILYDTVSYECVKYLKRKNSTCKIIMDMSAPNLKYMIKVYETEIKKEKINNDSDLCKMFDSKWYSKNLKRTEYEIKNADYYLVASKFSKMTLEYSNVKQNNIYICRYGANFNLKKVKKKVCDKIKIVFIGKTTLEKGFGNFIKVVEKLDLNKFEIHVIGSVNQNSIMYNKYKTIMKFYGYVTKDDVLGICEDMDIMLFTSLADGFGLSVTDAMSRGVAPIVSLNAGVSDIIIDNRNGFTFDCHDINKVIKVCNKLFENRNLLKKIQENAFDTVKNMKWDDYNVSIENMIKNILE